MCIGAIGWTEGLLILAVVLLLFGASRLPALARSLGKAANEFKKAKNEDGGDSAADKDDERHDA
ncbi:MAG: twin-arginine translocase TatA/TatE family subunit [Lentisphaeria bacterium]|jgi:sec-independent protein translocase protein TatA|nr:twin-arginine translocase TatA/TatE family subunit [Lentisphaeria bacterium]